MPLLPSTRSLSDLEKSESRAREWLQVEIRDDAKALNYLESRRGSGPTGEPINVDIFSYTIDAEISGIVFVGPLVWSFGSGRFLGEIPLFLLTLAYFGWLWVFPLSKDGSLREVSPNAEEYGQFERAAASIGCKDIKLLRCRQAGQFEYYVAHAMINGSDSIVTGAMDEVLAAPEAAAVNRIPIEYFMIGELLNK